MAGALAGGPVTIRPHVKAHKSPEIAQLQVDAGARGLSMATAWEAAVFAEAGFDDLFVVNTVMGDAKLRLLARLARERRVLVGVDDAGAAGALARACVAAGSEIGVVIEIDTGMDRAGLDDPALAGPLAARIAALPGLRVEGVTGYEGHCSLEDDVTRRAVLQRAAMGRLLDAVEAIRAEGLACPIVSAGGTRTWWLTAATPGITELQAGTYVLTDRFHAGIEGGFEPALRVLATVVSRPPDRVIVDAGSKSMAAPELTVILGHEDLPVQRFDEEHGIFARRGGGPAIGEVVQLVAGYAPSTVNLYDAYHVVEDGRVVDVWPVVPRGPGHHGLAYG
jgi:D-serine deaminase-like pyridoxal phosphate-dependent protein